jgi:hypothetical protein
MKEYFLHDGQNQIGPFSIEELRDKHIKEDSFVWKQGMNDWVKAGSVTELSDLFSSIPPPFSQQASMTAPVKLFPKTKASVASRLGRWVGRNPVKSILMLALIILLPFILANMSSSDYSYFSEQLTERKKSPEELRMELAMKEKQNPGVYLKPEITMRSNLIGQKVFEGSITNTASVATFKDIVIKFTFLSKTDAVIKEKSYTVYEIIPPKQAISIGKIKDFVSNDAKHFSVSITTATSVE